jgi:predicted lactoylglutathione lyase
MNEDTFNMEVRKFLKVVGVTSQREIEQVVRKALADGKLKANATLDAKVVLSIPALGLDHHIDGKIKTG